MGTRAAFTAVITKASQSLLLGQEPAEYPTWEPPSLAGRNRHCCWPCVGSRNCPTNPLGWFFPLCLVIFFQAWADVYWLGYLTDLQRFSLLRFFSTVSHHSVNSSCLGLPGCSAPSFQLRISGGLKAVSRYNCRTYFFCPQRSLFFVAWYTVPWKPLFTYFFLLAFDCLM